MAETSAVLKDERIQRYIKKLQKNFKDKRLIANMAGPIVFKDIISHFIGQKGPKSRWKKWSSEYAKVAKKRGQRMILQNTGRLRMGFLPGAWKKRTIIKSKSILWFNAMKVKGFPYAWAHDTGAGRLPKRSYMWLSNKGGELISKAVLKQIIKKAG